MARLLQRPQALEQPGFHFPCWRLPEPPRTPISRLQTRVCGAFCRCLPEMPMADHDLFFSRTGMDRARVQQTLDQALKGSDDGELYLEYSQSESFSFDDNRLKAATFDTS